MNNFNTGDMSEFNATIARFEDRIAKLDAQLNKDDSVTHKKGKTHVLRDFYRFLCGE